VLMGGTEAIVLDSSTFCNMRPAIQTMFITNCFAP
jgi:hypothetical protein